MLNQLHNNLGVTSIAVLSVLNHSECLPVSKSLLILPIIANKELLSYLSRKSTKIESVEQVIIKKTRCFSNFNARYYDALVTSFNALQFLHDIEMLSILNGYIYSNQEIIYHNSMGKRAEKIIDSSNNISKLLDTSATNLYVNLRVQI